MDMSESTLSPDQRAQSLADPEKRRRIPHVARERIRERAIGTRGYGCDGMMEPGDTLGEYRVLEVVSIGSMAIVYRAEHLELGREVALKVIAPPIADDEAFRNRFRREGRAVAKLNHPNIIPIYHSGEVDGRLFLEMRFINGKTLAERMHVDRLTAEQTISLLVPIADAIDAAHAVEIVHRDIKPQNIIVSADAAHPYLADFGIAKGVATADVTETRGFIGTLNYAAPEQILGRTVTPATDIYALTAVLYHCLTGRPAYPYETDWAVLHAHVYEPPPTVAADHPAAAGLNALTARGMAKEPGARFASATDLMREASELIHTWPAISPETLQPEDGNPPTNGRGRNGAVAARDASALAETSTQNGDELHGQRLATRMDHIEGESRNSTDAVTPTADHPRRARRGHRLMLGLGVVVALLVGGAVALVLRSSGSTPTHRGFTVSSTPFTITYQRPWRAVSVPVVGITALRVQPNASRGRSLRLALGYSTLTAGQLAVSSPIPGGVPPALEHRYGQRYKAADAVVAGDVGRQYTWSMPGGFLVAYVIPLRNGDAAVICRAPRAAGTALKSCGLLARNASVSEVEVVSPGPDGQLAHTLGTTLKPVAAAWSSLNWPRAMKLKARAAGAAKVTGIDSQAGAAVTRLTPPSRYAPEVARLGAALKDEATSLRALSKAAKSNNRAGYSRDATRVSAASRRLHTASKALSPFGLRVPVLPILRLAALPPLPSHTTVPNQSPSTQSSTTPASSTATQTATTPSTTSTPSSTPSYSPPPTTTQQQTTTSPKTNTGPVYTPPK